MRIAVTACLLALGITAAAPAAANYKRPTAPVVRGARFISTPVVHLRFQARERGVAARRIRFRCALDEGRLKSCPASFTARLAVGAHSLRVRAVDPRGRTGPITRVRITVRPSGPSVKSIPVSGSPVNLVFAQDAVWAIELRRERVPDRTGDEQGRSADCRGHRPARGRRVRRRLALGGELRGRRARTVLDHRLGLGRGAHAPVGGQPRQEHGRGRGTEPLRASQLRRLTSSGSTRATNTVSARIVDRRQGRGDGDRASGSSGARINASGRSRRSTRARTRSSARESGSIRTSTRSRRRRTASGTARTTRARSRSSTRRAGRSPSG